MNAIEPRPAFAGEALYDQLASGIRARSAAVAIRSALESYTPTPAEARVMLTSFKLFDTPRLRAALEDRFEDLDPNDMSYFDKDSESTGDGYDKGHPGEDMIDTVNRSIGNIFNGAMKMISHVSASIRSEVRDFYDARVHWFGNLEKEVANLKVDEEKLDGGPFRNNKIPAALAARPANKTCDNPSENCSEAGRASMQVMLLAEEIKNDSAAVARAMAGNKAALPGAIENLLRKIRGSATQSGDNLTWEYPSFSAVLTATMPRGIDVESITATDFNVSTIKMKNGEVPAVHPHIQRATPDDLQLARQYVRAGQMALDSAIKKNDKDILGTLASQAESENGLRESQINGVKSLIVFANRIHENLAMMAQQSHYNATYLMVYWIRCSVRDFERFNNPEQTPT